MRKRVDERALVGQAANQSFEVLNLLEVWEGLRRMRARGNFTEGVVFGGAEAPPFLYGLLVGYGGETGPQRLKPLALRLLFGTAEQVAEKEQDAASGVKTPDENASFMSELKLRPPEKQTFSAACEAVSRRKA